MDVWEGKGGYEYGCEGMEGGADMIMDVRGGKGADIYMDVRGGKGGRYDYGCEGRKGVRI